MSDDNKDLSEEELARLRGDVTDGADEEVEDDESSDDNADDGDDSDGDDDGSDGDDGGKGEGDESEGSKGSSKDSDEDPSPRIPKARLDEALSKAREREEQYRQEIEKLQSQVGSQRTQEDVEALRTKINEQEDQYEELLSDGKLEEAKQLRRSLNEARESLMDLKASYMGETARKAAVEELTYNQRLAGYEAEFPEINPDHDGFDQDVAIEVAELKDAFSARGYTPSASLDRAVKYVLAGKATPKSGDDRAVLRGEHNRKVRERNDKVRQQAPPDTEGAGKPSNKGGVGADSINPLSMTENQFEKLTEDQKRRLRGDSL